MAIARVLARRAKLEVPQHTPTPPSGAEYILTISQGESEADFAMSEMLMEQFCDVISLVANAKIAADQCVPLDMQLLAAFPIKMPVYSFCRR